MIPLELNDTTIGVNCEHSQRPLFLSFNSIERKKKQQQKTAMQMRNNREQNIYIELPHDLRSKHLDRLDLPVAKVVATYKNNEP